MRASVITGGTKLINIKTIMSSSPDYCTFTIGIALRRRLLLWGTDGCCGIKNNIVTGQLHYGSVVLWCCFRSTTDGPRSSSGNPLVSPQNYHWTPCLHLPTRNCLLEELLRIHYLMTRINESDNAEEEPRVVETNSKCISEERNIGTVAAQLICASKGNAPHQAWPGSIAPLFNRNASRSPSPDHIRLEFTLDSPEWNCSARHSGDRWTGRCVRGKA